MNEVVCSVVYICHFIGTPTDAPPSSTAHHDAQSQHRSLPATAPATAFQKAAQQHAWLAQRDCRAAAVRAAAGRCCCQRGAARLAVLLLVCSVQHQLTLARESLLGWLGLGPPEGMT